MDATLGDAMRERVRVRLAVLGETLADAARRGGMRRATVTSLVRRLPQVSVTSLLRLAEMLECRASWLIDGDLRDAVPESTAEDEGMASW